MSKPILAVDVDLTVVDALTPWLNWFYNKTGIRLVDEDMKGYDLVPSMRARMVERGIRDFDPFSFWEDPDLYDMMAPIVGSFEGIKHLVDELGAELVFVSTCVPNHEKSKRLFLARHCSTPHSFISTSSKWLVNYDILIDDNCKVIKDGLEKRPHALHAHYTHLLGAWKEPMPTEHKNYRELKSWDAFVLDRLVLNKPLPEIEILEFKQPAPV